MPSEKCKLRSVYRHKINNTRYSYMKVEVQSGIPTKIAFDGLRTQSFTGKWVMFRYNLICLIICSLYRWNHEMLSHYGGSMMADDGSNSYSWIELIARSSGCMNSLSQAEKGLIFCQLWICSQKFSLVFHKSDVTTRKRKLRTLDVEYF